MCNTNGGGSDEEQPKRRGALIVLEGLDRSGKTTQAAKLLEYLESKGKSARIQRFPDREEPLLGPLIDQFLRNAKNVNESREVIHLLFSANRWALAAGMREELAAGRTLIVDRYSYSGVTYSLAKGLDPTWTAQPEVGLPKPDVVLFFDVPPEKTSQRGGFGDEVMERSDFQKLVYNNLKAIFNEAYWKKINAGDTIENVHSSVTAEVDRVLEALDRGETQKPQGTLALCDFGL